MSNVMKRFGFRRSGTTNGPDEVLENPDYTVGPILDANNVPQDEKSGVESGRTINEVEANRRLSMFQKTHRWDPNLGNDTFDDIEEVTEARDGTGEAKVIGEILDNSPYPEVRAAVRNYDEELPTSTIRAWVIGMVLTTLGSGLNLLFSLRQPSISITSLVAQLVAYPLGVGWAKVFPNREFRTFGITWNLNPGPFNIKEHTLIVVMANASFGQGSAYFSDTLTAQRAFYGQNFGWGFNILLALTTQVTGFGIAGIMRKFLVEPASMIWPFQLVNTAFMYTLHDHSKTDPTKTNGWSISRYKYFFIVFVASFVWYWFPGYIATFLSAFAFVTWIKPNNVIINQLFGAYTGISLIPLSFDWTQVTGYVFSPLVAPWHAIANTLIGTIFFFWIVTCGMHYSGHLFAEYLPISSSSSYDNTGAQYNVTKILTPQYTLDLAAYKAYSPLFLSTTFQLAYGISFASIASVIVHSALFHGQEIWIRAKAAKGSLDDVHTRMMRKYKPVPDWWYGILFLACFGASMGTVYGWPTHLSWWALIVGFLISLVWTIPIGMIQGATNIQLGLNVFTEFLIGYMQPGRPVAMMLFKTYGYITMTQALSFLQDLKLGHYIKVPQRSMFWGQLVATVWSAIVQLGVLEWAFSNISDMCSLHQKNFFNCPNGRVFFNASIIWGLIGPQRIFSPGSIYSSLQWFWLAGVALPVVIYIGARMFPRSKIRFLSAPIIFGGTGEIPPATPLNYLTWGIVGWFFNRLIRNRYRGWWMRFNYITSAGLDTGLAISTIVIIAALNLTNTNFPDWWGTTYWQNTADLLGTAVQKVLPPGQVFGPTHW